MQNVRDELNKTLDGMSKQAKDHLFQFVLQNMLQQLNISTIKDLMQFKNDVESRLTALESAAKKPAPKPPAKPTKATTKKTAD